LRAYGDRELFQRFKVRFVVAPLFLVAVCVFCISQEFTGLTLVLYAWGVWHGLAQTYGFLRIYDAKVLSSATLTCRLDLAMCVAWFGGLVVLSPTRLHRVLEMFYASGGPVVPAAWLQGARAAAQVVLVAVTLAFLVHLLVGWRRGQRPSPLKLLTMLTSFGFWWYCNIAVSNLLLGILLFEVFHDVQYLSIVWAFNRSRAEKGALSGLSRLLFRPRAALTFAYVGLVFAYGTLSYAANGLPSAMPRRCCWACSRLRLCCISTTTASSGRCATRPRANRWIWREARRRRRRFGSRAGSRMPSSGSSSCPLAGLAVAQTRGWLPISSAVGRSLRG
jgi:hypothetical protein